MPAHIIDGRATVLDQVAWHGQLVVAPFRFLPSVVVAPCIFGRTQPLFNYRPVVSSNFVAQRPR